MPIYRLLMIFFLILLPTPKIESFDCDQLGVGDQHHYMHRLHNICILKNNIQNIDVNGFSNTSPKHRWGKSMMFLVSGTPFKVWLFKNVNPEKLLKVDPILHNWKNVWNVPAFLIVWKTSVFPSRLKALATTFGQSQEQPTILTSFISLASSYSSTSLIVRWVCKYKYKKCKIKNIIFSPIDRMSSSTCLTTNGSVSSKMTSQKYKYRHKIKNTHDTERYKNTN